MEFNLHNYWNKKQSKKDKFYEKRVEIGDRIYKKLKQHGDENLAEESEKELKKHFKKGEPTWHQMKKVFKKRFPYLTYEELDFIHQFGGVIKEHNLTEFNWRYKL